jgi:hypothetical protein
MTFSLRTVFIATASIALITLIYVSVFVPRRAMLELDMQLALDVTKIKGAESLKNDINNVGSAFRTEAYNFVRLKTPQSTIEIPITHLTGFGSAGKIWQLDLFESPVTLQAAAAECDRIATHLRYDIKPFVATWVNKSTNSHLPNFMHIIRVNNAEYVLHMRHSYDNTNPWFVCISINNLVLDVDETEKDVKKSHKGSVENL